MIYFLFVSNQIFKGGFFVGSYETICIFHPETKEDRIDAILKKLGDKIKASGGEVEEVKKWGMKRLAFTFKKDKHLKDGFFVEIDFKGDGGVPLELQKQLKVIEDVLRFMISRAVPAAAVAAEAGEEKKVEIAPSMFIKEEKKG